MTSLTVWQYRWSDPVELPGAVVMRLLADHATRVEVRPAAGQRVQLRGTNHVGTLRVEGLDLLIQPKVQPLSVLWMLGFADRLVTWDPSDVDLAEGDLARLRGRH